MQFRKCKTKLLNAFQKKATDGNLLQRATEPRQTEFNQTELWRFSSAAALRATAAGGDACGGGGGAGAAAALHGIARNSGVRVVHGSKEREQLGE